MNEIFRSVCATSLLLMAAGCTPEAPRQPAPLAGTRIGGHFTLTDQHGQRISDTRFAGKYRIMYFGYTYCPDVCPVDVQNIAGAMRLLDKSDPALASRIVPIFVTVDPERDTPPVLKQFVGAFHPRMIGLTGSPAEIAAVAREFAIYYHKQAPGLGGGGYIVDHSRQAYLMNPKGEPLALLPQDKTPDAIVAEIRRWAS